jgi:hypothetical protein
MVNGKAARYDIGRYIRWRPDAFISIWRAQPTIWPTGDPAVHIAARQTDSFHHDGPTTDQNAIKPCSY